MFVNVTLALGSRVGRERWDGIIGVIVNVKPGE